MTTFALYFASVALRFGPREASAEAPVVPA
jgi:hypothetical protein